MLSELKQMNEGYIEGDKGTKLKLAVLLGLALLLFYFSELIPNNLFSNNLPSFEFDPDKAVQNIANQIFIYTIISALLFWGAAFYFIKLGLRIKKNSQYPPPGMRMAFRTKIRRGKQVTYMWVMLYILAGLFVVKPLAGLYIWYKVIGVKSVIN